LFEEEANTPREDKVQKNKILKILSKKKPTSNIVPTNDKTKKKERTIGLLDGKVTIQISDNFSMSEEELSSLKNITN